MRWTRLKMALLYLDTNIIIYAGEDNNIYGKDLSGSSSKLLFDVITCKHKVIISDWLLKELSGLKKVEQCSMILKMLKPKTRIITYSEEDIKKAKEMNPKNFGDELHGILAIRARADYIVTRNIKDFVHLRHKIKVVKPEELF